MIILRYLSRELIVTCLSITAVLVVVIMSGDFTRYLWEAISGKIDAGVLLALIAYRIPGFLELILPLGFFVAILMVYGRLYAEQEMTVLFSCGLSRTQLVVLTYAPAFIIAAVTAFISLWLSPYGVQESERIKEEQQSRSELDLLQSSRFQVVNDGKLVTYIEPTEDEQQSQHLGDVFVATMNEQEDESLVVLRATNAHRARNAQYQQDYLVLEEGARYEGRPGQADYRVTRFSQFAQRLEPPTVIEFQTDDIEALSSIDLWQQGDRASLVELQWRFSVPVIVFVVALLGVALSHTTPRRGRYVMLFPSILLYMVYVVLLNAVRDSLDDGRLSLAIGLWAVHLGFLLLGIGLFILRGGVNFRKKQQRVKPL